MSKGPILYDSLDRQNAPAVQKPAAVSREALTEKVVLATLALVVGMVLLAVYFLYDRSTYAYHYGIGGEVALGGIGLFFVYALIITFLIGMLGVIFRYGYLLAQRAGLINIMEHQTTINNIPSETVALYAEINRLRAENSIYQGVQTLTEGDRNKAEISNVANGDAKAAPMDITKVLPKGSDGTLTAMDKAGLLKNNQLLIGFEAVDAISNK